MQTKIWVTFQRVGFHAYPNAPEQVAYLAQRHRHVFKFKVTTDVFHNDRDIEFHMFQTELNAMYDSGQLELNDLSCESIATNLIYDLQRKYPNRRFEVEVSEDGECGSVVSMF